MSAESGSVSPSLPCVAVRLRPGPADDQAVSVRREPGRRGKAGMYFRIRTLDSEGYLTHQDSSEAPGAGRTASGFPPNGHSLATRRAYFEAGMLRQMNDMHGYRSPRRRGRLAGSVFWVQRRVSRVCVNSRCSTLTPLRLVTLVVSLDKADALIDGMYSRIITKLPRVFSQAGSFNPETLAGSMSDCRKAFVAGRDLTQEYNSARMAALSCGCPRKRESY